MYLALSYHYQISNITARTLNNTEKLTVIPMEATERSAVYLNGDRRKTKKTQRKKTKIKFLPLRN